MYKALRDTGVAGIPGEHLYLSFEEEKDLPGLSPFDQYRHKLWAKGTTPNGVLGVNHDLNGREYLKFYKKLSSLRGDPSPGTDHEDLWKEIFPNCKHIFLTRRNKLRQAISWWRAIKDQVWHLGPGDSHQNPEEFYVEHYDLAALKHLLSEILLKEAATQEYFDRHGIEPLNLVYEEMVADFPQALKRVLEYLELYEEGMILPAPYYHPTADVHTEIWLKRLHEDLQADDAQFWLWD